MAKFDKLIDLLHCGEQLNQENVGEEMIFVDRGSCQLIIPKDNTPEHGIFFINSIQGHDCYSYNSVSTHTYHVLEGTGRFVIDNNIVDVIEGDTVVIQPNSVFAYMGTMLLTLEMTPNFVEENDHFVCDIDYTKKGPELK